MPIYPNTSDGVMTRSVRISDTDDVKAAARRIRSQGVALTQSMHAIMAEIETSESHSSTFPSDEFTDAFLANYRQPVAVGDGGQLPANEAVRAGARSLGQAMADFADAVVEAMDLHADVEDQGAVGIRGARVGGKGSAIG